MSTIKYYVREGLVPPGEPTARTQAVYGEPHLRRLRLLRVLREIGGIPIERIRVMVDATAEVGRNVHDVFRLAADALAPPPPAEVSEAARAFVDRLLAEAGWDRIRPDAPDRDNLAAAFDAVASAGMAEGGLAVLRTYVEAADTIARADLDTLVGDDAAALLPQMVVGQVVFGEILLTLRRLAEEHHSARRFADGPPAAAGRG